MSADGHDLLALFQTELETQVAILGEGLVEAEGGGEGPETLERLMRAAHSLKGAARIVGLDAIAALTHAMEDCVVAAQRGERPLTAERVDQLLAMADLLKGLLDVPPEGLAAHVEGLATPIEEAMRRLGAAPPASTGKAPDARPAPAARKTPLRAPAAPAPEEPNATLSGGREGHRVLRLSEDALNRLLGLASETLVESRRLGPFAERLLRLKRRQRQLESRLDALCHQTQGLEADEALHHELKALRRAAMGTTHDGASLLEELSQFDYRFGRLSRGLYGEVLRTHMRPFSDIVGGLPRLVRDTARDLGKGARLVVRGEGTQVDRTILELLHAPLSHLLRNAVDHGIEPSEVRRHAGKAEAGTIALEAQHQNGMLVVSVSDDGAGIDMDRVRARIVERGLSTQELVANMGDTEVLAFLFLPGFSMRDEVTDISGRGVGLDAVHTMVQLVQGELRAMPRPDGGTRFELVLPLTLSVIRVLLVEIGGDTCAFGLARIQRAMRVERDAISTVEGKACIDVDGQAVGLLRGTDVLGLPPTPDDDGPISVLLVGTERRTYGVVVDGFLGEREVVVQPLDRRLGKLRNVSAGAVLDDGHAALIIDVDDFLRSIDMLITDGSLRHVNEGVALDGDTTTPRILVVDDSITVRETERQLLAANGFDVEVAVDGMDGWNTLREGGFDLVLTDVDMPRMDGLRLTERIKGDPQHRDTPVVIVSYKDRREDRDRGLAAGADHYLAKSSFHDDSLLDVVRTLLGRAA